MSCFRLAIWTITATLGSPLYAGFPSDYMQMALGRREAIRSLEMRAEVHRGVFTADSEDAEVLSGATFVYHFWLSPSVKRVDCIESRPKDPSNAAFQKFARAGGILRTIPGTGDVIFSERAVGTEPHGLEEDLAIEPRLVGFWPEHFELLKQISRDDLLGLCDDDVVSTSLTRKGNQILISGKTTSPPKLAWQFRFDSNLNVPTSIRLSGFSGDDTLDTLETKWSTVDDVAVPVNARFERSHGGELIRSETWSMSWTSINRPIDATVATWASLGIKDGDVVRFEGVDDARYGQWIKGKFRDWRPTPIAPGSAQFVMDDVGFGRRLFFAVSLVFFGAVLLYFGGRRLIGKLR